VGYQAVQPASLFVTGDTDAAPQSASFHISNRLEVKKLHNLSVLGRILDFLNKIGLWKPVQRM